MSFLEKILAFLPFQKSKQQRVLAHNLYVSLVTDARNPSLFTSCDIADTVDGRFDVIVLHLTLILRRLKDAKENCSNEEDAAQIEAISQELIGVYNTDMDRNLREIGVGDMSVGKHVKKMAKAFYGRLFAYDEAINIWQQQKDDSKIKETLKRNVYRGEAGEQTISALLSYVGNYLKHLDTVDVDTLKQGILPRYKSSDGRG